MNEPKPTAPMNIGRFTAFRARAVSHTGRGISRGNSPVICAMQRFSLAKERTAS